MMRGKNNPEAQKRMAAMKALHAEFKEKVTAFGSANEKEQEAIRKELVVMAGKIFDQKQEIRNSRLENAKARIVELETEIKERDTQRTELIDQFVDTATGEALEGL